jgi:hypothetical protein
MRKINQLNFDNKSSIQESRTNDLNQDHDQTQSFISDIKNRISSISLDREESTGRSSKKQDDSFDAFRMFKQGFMGVLKMMQKTGLIDKEDYKEKKEYAKDFFKENKANFKKMFLQITQRDLETVLEYIESQLTQTNKNSKVNYEQEEIIEDDLNPQVHAKEENKEASTANDGKNLELTLTSTLKFNNIGNSLLNLLNTVEPFDSPDELSVNDRQYVKSEITETHAKTKDLILSLDPSLQDKLNTIDQRVAQNPDKNEAYMSYSVSMVPIDIASKAIDIVNNEREGFQDLADLDRKTLAADMMDFYEYMTNLKENLG